MKITCESCGAKYTIADDKVRGRKVKIRCKGCGTPIVVDGQQSDGEVQASDDQQTDEPDSTLPIESSASPSDDEWSVNLSDTDQRTLTTAQVVELWRDGVLTTDAFVWREGMADWVPVLDSAELGPLLREATPGASAATSSSASSPAAASSPVSATKSAPQQPSSPQPASLPQAASSPQPASLPRPPASAARVSGGRAQGAPDLFAGVERAGADDDELSSSAPALPHAASARQEEALTGARNENSVLFSLDALKAGFAGPAAKPSSPPAGERARPSSIPTANDPFGMGSGLSGMGGGTPLFTLADNQALLTAPPPPEPPPRPVEAMPSVGGASLAPGLGKRNLMLLGGGAVVLLIAGLALGIGLGKKQESSSAAASASALARNDAKEDKASEEKPSPKAEEKAAADPGATADAGKGDEKTVASASAKSEPPSGTITKRDPGRESPKKEEPKAAAPPSTDQPFNRGAALSALSAAASQAASCKKIGGPTGSGKVSITFAPSGRATSANVVGAPFAGTAVGGCIASIFRKAKVPPFSGNALTVTKSFTIR